jgi:hypothetical protein
MNEMLPPPAKEKRNEEERQYRLEAARLAREFADSHRQAAVEQTHEEFEVEREKENEIQQQLESMNKELEEKEEWKRHLQCSVFPDVRFGQEVSGFLSSVEKDDLDKTSQLYSIHGDFNTLNALKKLWDLLMEQRTQYIETQNFQGVERCDSFIQDVKSRIHQRLDRVSAWILEVSAVTPMRLA